MNKLYPLTEKITRKFSSNILNPLSQYIVHLVKLQESTKSNVYDIIYTGLYYLPHSADLQYHNE